MQLGEVSPPAHPTTPLRTSSYTIYVDLKEDRENTLLVHGYTGAFDLVNRRVAAFLHRGEKRKPPKPLYGEWSDDSADVPADGPTPSESTVALLQRRGYLTPMTVEEEQSFFLYRSGRHVARGIEITHAVVRRHADL